MSLSAKGYSHKLLNYIVRRKHSKFESRYMDFKKKKIICVFACDVIYRSNMNDKSELFLLCRNYMYFLSKNDF